MGAIATNSDLAHLDPSTEDGCPFCLELDTVYQLVVQCPSWTSCSDLLQRWFSGLGEGFSYSLFFFF